MPKLTNVEKQKILVGCKKFIQSRHSTLWSTFNLHDKATPEINHPTKWFPARESGIDRAAIWLSKQVIEMIEMSDDIFLDTRDPETLRQLAAFGARPSVDGE